MAAGPVIPSPCAVHVHDFPWDAIFGKAIPYGVYDMALNEAWVSVGRDHDTPAFAVAAIRQWWTMMGRRAYPAATALYITAECGRQQRLIGRARGRRCLQRLGRRASSSRFTCRTFRQARASGIRSSTGSSATSRRTGGGAPS